MIKAVHIILESAVYLGQIYTEHGYLFFYVLNIIMYYYFMLNQIHCCYENVKIYKYNIQTIKRSQNLH